MYYNFKFPNYYTVKEIIKSCFPILPSNNENKLNFIFLIFDSLKRNLDIKVSSKTINVKVIEIKL